MAPACRGTRRRRRSLPPDPFSGADAAASAATVPCEAQREWGAPVAGAGPHPSLVASRTPCAAISARASASEPSMSMARQASSSTVTPKPSLAASSAE